MPDYPFRNLIFEGGGVKGIAYAGTMEEQDKEGISMRGIITKKIPTIIF